MAGERASLSMDQTSSFAVSSFLPSEQGAGPGTAPGSAPFCRLQATGGQEVIVDPDVAERLAGRRITPIGHGYFAVRLDGRRQYLHHFVFGRPAVGEIDHKDRDKANNRRENLRVATRSQNLLNAARAPGRSGFLGVHQAHRGPRWCGRVSYVGRDRETPQLREALLAALSRDDLMRRVGGDFGVLNFPRRLGLEEAAARIRSLGDTPFTAWFVKRSNGRIRRITCRTVSADLSSLAFDPASRGLLPVLEIETDVYRFIPLEGLLCLQVQDQRFRMVR